MNNLDFGLSPLALTIGWTIVHTLWQSMLIAVVLKVILSILSNRFSNIRYIMSCVALVSIVVWSSWTFSEEWQLHQGLGIVVFELPTVATQIVEGEVIIENALQITYPTVWKASISDYIPLVTGLWFIGTICFTFWLIYGFVRLQQLQRKGIYPTPNDWKRRLVALCQQMGITRKVELLISDNVAGPITFRLFRPVILMPVQLFTGLTILQIEILLLHELAHIRRYDYVVNLFQSIIEVLLFYHPAVWWINRQIRLEREHCCDDLVLRIQNNPDLYARVLTNVQITHFSSKTKLAMSANQNRGHFTTRIHRLFGKYEYTVFSVRGALIALLLVSGLLVQELSAQQEVENAPEKMELTESVDKPLTEELVQPEMVTEAIPEPTIEEERISESFGDVESVETEPLKEEIAEPATELATESASTTASVAEQAVDTLPKPPTKAKNTLSPYPPKAEPGKCYVQCVLPEHYEEVTEEYFIYTGNPDEAPKNATKKVIEIKPASTKWVKKKVVGKECLSKDPEDCKVWCLVDVPAVTEEILLLDDVGDETDFERKVVKKKVLKKENKADWVEVLCPANQTPKVIRRIQKALGKQGFDAGSAVKPDKQFNNALKQYQKEHQLPVGGLNMKTLYALGIFQH